MELLFIKWQQNYSLCSEAQIIKKKKKKIAVLWPADHKHQMYALLAIFIQISNLMIQGFLRLVYDWKRTQVYA